jgi:uncharacterized protein
MQAERPRRVTVELDVGARMRDGVVLRANVYRPDGVGPWPTLLTRTPYMKDDPLGSATLDPVAAARSGFMVVVQDVRGRFASEGEWRPLRYEREDGYDSVEWAAQLPGSNGRVGMYGGSYCGSTQWLAAAEAPPSLAAIAPQMTWCEPLDGLFSRGGAQELGLAVPWTLHQGAAELARLPISEQERRQRYEALIDDCDSLRVAGYWELPVHDLPVLRRHGLPDLGTIDVLSDAQVADWCRVAGFHERVTVPSLHIGGWHDIFIQGTLDNYMAMVALGRPARLLVGPWAHGNARLADPTGELHFGLRSNGLGVPSNEHGDVNDLQLAWMRQHLDLEADMDFESAPVRVFAMGRDEWRDLPSWPPPGAAATRWFLHADAGLRPTAPAADEPTEFVYDPADPVPTLGGQTANIPAAPPGPFEQATVEARPDVCTFTSDVLREELELTGRVRVVLHAESSAPSTDWVARLCDVHPDGRSYNVCDGVVRVAEGADVAGPVEIDLWSTSNVFLPGHRLRLQVTSSCFPRWDRNLNSGDQRQRRHASARQRIHHDVDRASFVELPVVDG